MRFPAKQGVGIGESLDQGWTLPSSWFFDPDVAAAEQQKIFAPSWRYVARTDQLARSGDYVATEANGAPIVIVRDREGGLRGYLNICPHRAHRVATGEGRRQTLQCAYHAWTFNLDGTLRSAPRSECETDFDTSEVSLLPVAVAEWGPMVFANATPDPISFEEAFENLPARAEEMGLDFGEYHYSNRRQYEIECNWKVYVDNATECYHCEPVHSAGFADRFSTVTKDFQRNLVYGKRCFSYSIPYRDPSREGEHAFQLYFAWPGFMMMGELNHMFYVVQFEPGSPTSTKIMVDYFFHNSIPEEGRAGELEMWIAAADEDVVVNESVQEGLNSNMLPQGRYFLQEERLLGHLQRLVYDAIKDDVGPLSAQPVGVGS